MKPILMIHEFHDWMKRLPLKDYILTFDDGLFSQYYYFNFLKKIPTEKIFFISTNIIHSENSPQSTEFPSCQEAHKEYFNTGNTCHYMNWEQIKEIHQTPSCHIGGHSHKHLRYDNLGIKELYINLKQDTQEMIREFNHQDIKIKHFCYPYNIQYPLYQKILEQYGVQFFFGNERIPIESISTI